jgi:hypothetical protein
MRWFAVLLLGIAACAPSLSGAEGDFKAGRLPAAKEKLVGLEPASATWSEPRRAEYALYRGLVHHGLGDRSAALVWLRQANEHAALLSEDDRTRLKLALDAIGPSE